MNHPYVRPVKVYRFDPELGVEIRRTVGFQAMLGDHSLAPARSTFAEARSDLPLHREPAKPQPRTVPLA